MSQIRCEMSAVSSITERQRSNFFVTSSTHLCHFTLCRRRVCVLWQAKIPSHFANKNRSRIPRMPYMIMLQGEGGRFYRDSTFVTQASCNDVQNIEPLNRKPTRERVRLYVLR